MSELTTAHWDIVRAERRWRLLFRLVLTCFVFVPQLHAQQALYVHGEPSDYEQLALEIINRTRMQPSVVAGEQGLSGLSLTPVAPLAFHKTLVRSAQEH